MTRKTKLTKLIRTYGGSEIQMFIRSTNNEKIKKRRR